MTSRRRTLDRKLSARHVGALVLLSSLAGLACNVTGVRTDRFVVRVDSISAPDAIAATTPLTIRVWGVLGPDLCSRLDQVERQRSAGSIELRFRGERTGGGNCPQMPAPLRYEETILPPFEDPFTIRVLQPDGTPVEREVRVR